MINDKRLKQALTASEGHRQLDGDKLGSETKNLYGGRKELWRELYPGQITPVSTHCVQESQVPLK